MKLSLCLIVKNEEKVLEESLNSIFPVVDEIIVVDTGSTDGTIEIAKKFTNKIYHFEWIDDFSAARNFAQQFANYEYILRWDADCVLRKGIENLALLKKQNFHDKDLISFTWNVDFGKNKEPIRQLSTIFVYKKDLFHWEYPIHNSLFPNDKDHKPSVLHALNVEIDHLKDPVEKAHRYEQTAKIIRRQLEKDPTNIKLIVNEAENFIFLKKFEEAEANLKRAISLIKKKDSKLILAVEALVQTLIELKKYEEANELSQKYFNETKDPRMLLCLADTLAIVFPSKAIEKYEMYLKNPYQKNLADGPFNYERYVVHPHNILAILYSDLNKGKSEQYLIKAKSLTKK